MSSFRQVSKSPAAHQPPADRGHAELSVPVPGWLPAMGTAPPLPWPRSWVMGRQVLRNSTAASLGNGGCGNTSPLLQSRVRQGSESHLPGQSSSARGSRATPGGREVLSRSDTSSRMETEHLNRVIHISYKPKEPSCFCLHMAMQLCSRGGMCC